MFSSISYQFLYAVWMAESGVKLLFGKCWLLVYKCLVPIFCASYYYIQTCLCTRLGSAKSVFVEHSLESNSNQFTSKMNLQMYNWFRLAKCKILAFLKIIQWLLSWFEHLLTTGTSWKYTIFQLPEKTINYNIYFTVLFVEASCHTLGLFFFKMTKNNFHAEDNN